MSEIVVKVDVPAEFKELFEASLTKVVNKLVEDLEFIIAKELISHSKLSEERSKELADEVSVAVAKRHGLT